MFFLLAVIIGLIIGFARGGRLKNLGNAKLSFWIPGILGALLLALWHLHRYIPFLLNQPAAVPVIGFIGYVLLMVALIFNLDSVWAILMMVGTVSDFVVTFINGGKMPVLESILRLTGDQNVIDAVMNGTHASYGLLTVSNSTLWFLGINVPIPVPVVGTITNLFGGMPGLSIGSMVLLVGLVGWISHQLVSHDFRKALLDDLSSDANSDFILDEEERLSEARLAGDYVEKNETDAVKEEQRATSADVDSKSGEAETLVSQELFKRDSAPLTFSEKPDYFEQVHALQTGELLVTDIEGADSSGENASDKTEVIGVSDEAMPETPEAPSSDKTEVVPVIKAVSRTSEDFEQDEYISPPIKPRAFVDDDTKILTSLRDLKSAEIYAPENPAPKQASDSPQNTFGFGEGRQGQGHAVDFNDFEGDAYEDDVRREAPQNTKPRWEIPEAGRDGFIANQKDDSDRADGKSGEFEPAWVVHPTYHGKTPKEKTSYKKNPYRKASIQEGNTMKKDENKKSEQDMMNVWHQMSEDNQAIRQKRRRKNYDADDSHPFAQKPKSAPAEQKSSERADYSHYEQASAAGRRKQAEQAKEAEAKRAVDERPKRRRSTDEERRRAGFEKVEVNVDGRIVTFWRKRKDK